VPVRSSTNTIFKATFLLIIVVSSIFLVMSTSNYVEFFIAVRELSLQTLDVSASIGPEDVSITLVFAICNPTRYTGLAFQQLTYTLLFEVDDNNTTLYGGLISYRAAPEPIGAYSNMTFNEEISLNPNVISTEDFRSLYETRQEDITWILQGTAIFLSFVGTIDVPLSDEFS